MFKPRQIPQSEIAIGDAIRVEYIHGDLHKSQGGRIRRKDRGGWGVEYITERGYIVLTVYRSGETEPKNIQNITLLDRRDMTETPLPGMDELVKELS